MSNDDIYSKALDDLLRYSDFSISGIDYSEKNFGNTYIVLSSVYQVDLRFIRERGVFWCEIGKAGEWFFLEDILTLLGITELESSSEFMEFAEKVSKLVKRNLSQITNLFTESNFLTTKINIKKIATERAKGMFGLY